MIDFENVGAARELVHRRLLLIPGVRAIVVRAKAVVSQGTSDPCVVFVVKTTMRFGQALDHLKTLEAF